MKLDLLFESDLEFRRLQRAARSGDAGAVGRFQRAEERVDDLLVYWRNWPVSRGGRGRRRKEQALVDGLAYAIGLGDRASELLFRIAKWIYKREGVADSAPRNIDLLFRKWMNHIRRGEVFRTSDGRDSNHVYEILHRGRGPLASSEYVTWRSPDSGRSVDIVYGLYKWLQSMFHERGPADTFMVPFDASRQSLFIAEKLVSRYFWSFEELWSIVLGVYPHYGDKGAFMRIVEKWEGEGFNKPRPVRQQFDDLSPSDLSELL